MSRYVAVKLQNSKSPGEYSGREYTYIDAVGLFVGDMVKAPTANGEMIACVTRVNVPETEIAAKIRPILKTITQLHDDQEVADNG